MTEALTQTIIEQLASRLADDSAEVRGLAATGLSALSPERLQNAVQTDQHNARIAAVSELAKTERLDGKTLSEAMENTPSSITARLIMAASPSHTDSSAWEVIVSALGHPEPQVRVAAAITLGQSQNLAMTPPLVAALGDEVVRQEALASLHKLGWTPESGAGRAALALAGRDFDALNAMEEDALPLLTTALQTKGRDRDSVELRASLCAVLEHYKSKAVIGLIAGCLSDVGSAARAASARALGARGKDVPQTVKQSLRELLQDDHSPKVRLAAAIALGRLRDIRAADTLERSAMGDDSSAVRYAASEALARLGSNNHLIESLQSPDPLVRKDAAISLGELNVLEAIDPLIDVLTDPLATVRSAAFTALEMLKWTPVGVKFHPTDERYSRWMTRSEQLQRADRDTSQAVDQAELLALDLQADDPMIRQAALEALAMRADDRLSDLAKGLLDDDDPHVRKTAAATLEQLGAIPTSGASGAAWLVATGRMGEAAALGNDAITALLRSLQQSTSDKRAEIVRVLAPLEHKDVTAAICAALADTESFVRTNAVMAIASHDSKRAVTELEKCLEDSHSVVRNISGRTLLTLGDSGVEAVLNALSHPEATIRQVAGDSLSSNSEVAGHAVLQLLSALEQEPEDTVKCALLRGLAAAGEALAQHIEPIAAELRKSESYKTRIEAATALGRSTNMDAAAAIQSALGDSYPSVRQAALRALHDLGWTPSGEVARAMVALASDDWRTLKSVGSAAIPLLTQTLNETSADKDAVERRARAIDTLSSVGAMMQGTGAAIDAVVAPLIDRLSDISGPARAAAARGLGLLEAVRAGDALLKLALSDANEHVRISALIALARCGNSDMAHVLMEIASTDASEHVRLAASRALAGPSIGNIAPLVAAMMSIEASVRTRAAKELGELGNPDAIDPLILRLGDADSSVRAAARQALGNLNWEPVGIRGDDHEPGFRRWLSRTEVLDFAGGADASLPQSEVLVQALESTDAGVRRASLEAIGARRATDAIAHVIDALRDDDRSVRSAAADALKLMNALPKDGEDAAWALVAQGKVGAAGQLGDVAENALLTALRDEPEDTRPILFDALGHVHTERAHDARISALLEPSAAVRLAVCRTIDVSQGWDALVGSLDDPDAQVRVTAAIRLLDTDPEESHLIDILESQGPLGKKALLQQLPMSEGGPALLEWLKRASSDADDARVRETSLQALARLSVDEVLDLAARLATEDTAPIVRIAAVDTLGQHGRPEDIPALLTALGDEYGEVRTAVLDALESLKYEPEDAITEATIALEARDWRTLRTLGAPAAPLITRTLKDQEMDPGSQQKRAAAVETLGYIDDDASLEGIAIALNDGSAKVRANAIDAIAHLKSLKLGPALLERLAEDTSAQVRARAATTIGSLGYAAGAVALSHAASQDPDATVRSAAAVALAGPGIGKTERLIAQLGDTDPEMRRAAALALSPLRDLRALDPLVSTLADAFTSVREAAKCALAELDWVPVGLRRHADSAGYDRWILRQELTSSHATEDEVIPQIDILRQARTHADPMMRLGMVEALETIGSEDAMQILVECTTDSVSYVASAATAALDALRQKAAQEKERSESAPEDAASTSEQE